MADSRVLTLVDCWVVMTAAMKVVLKVDQLVVMMDDAMVVLLVVLMVP